MEAADNHLNASNISAFAHPGSDSADPSKIEGLIAAPDRREAALAEFQTEFDVMLQFFS